MFGLYKKRTKSKTTGKSTNGFTLIELLVVVAIIGILSSVVLASLNGVRVKSRHAKRISDLKQIETALTFYANDHNYQYPLTCNAGVDPCNTWYGPHLSGTAREDWIPGLVSAGYIKVLPRDPRDPGGTNYIPIVNTTQYVYASNGTDFKLIVINVEDCSGFLKIEPTMTDPMRPCGSTAPSAGVWSSSNTSDW